MKPASLVRPSVRALHAYVPGEQPKIKGLIKLNTNENPYPPAPPVLRAIRKAVDGRLRLYPNPTAQPLREALARRHSCEPRNIIIGNGSDELLALATRAFVEPIPAVSLSPETGGEGRGEGVHRKPKASLCTIQYFTPSYSLYPVLADIHGAIRRAVPLAPDFSIPPLKDLKREKKWDFRAALTLLTTPNAPSGRGYATDQLEELCRAQKGVVILDEAYVDFADEHAMDLALRLPNVIVSRTFSKAYSLCFQRIGYWVGHPDLIAGLDQIRDSYNVNGLGQVAALETLRHAGHYRRNFETIKRTRTWLTGQLTGLGFETLPSQTNFILTRPPVPPASEWLERLRARKILVRWFSAPEISDFLRITIGTPDEARKLVTAATAILRDVPKKTGSR